MKENVRKSVYFLTLGKIAFLKNIKIYINITVRINHDTLLPDKYIVDKNKNTVAENNIGLFKIPYFLNLRYSKIGNIGVTVFAARCVPQNKN